MSNTFSSQNPATNETIWSGKNDSKEDIDTAIDKAKQAFKTWSLLSIDDRIKYLKKYQELLTHYKEALAETISIETGKTLWETTSEVTAMIGKIDISIEAQKDRCRTLKREIGTTNSITYHKPHGVVAVFGPFNFPGHLPNGHIVPALLAGNTVVFKPSELAPYVGEKLIYLWKKASLPEGVINLVQGGPETGKNLAEHPKIDALFFTGSWHVGKALSEHYGKHPEKLLALEMGGNNPLIITNVSDIKAAVYTTLQSAFITTGQRCSCVRRLIVVGENENYLNSLIKAAQKIKIGPYNQTPEPFMGPLIHEKAAQTLLQAQENFIKNGAKPLLSAKKLKIDLPFITPSILDTTSCKEKKDREIFGPLLQVIRVNTLEDAIKEANNTSFGLTAGLLSDSKKEYELVYQSVKAGVINWNTQITGASSGAPFGGLGHSGNHRPSAYYAADYCSYPVATMQANELKLPDKRVPGVEL